ncbi:MAG: SRPBCC domain-containing protein [Actinomycetota bacterium]|nr:SRPBCC domain-containing protein [Actinomycetota bacterium]
MRERSSEPVRREIRLDASPAEVWRALTESSLLAAWFEADVEIDPRSGGAIRFRFPDASELRGLIEIFEPQRRIGLRWRDPLRGGEPAVVVLSLEALEDGTRLMVTEVQGRLAPDTSMEAVAR